MDSHEVEIAELEKELEELEKDDKEFFKTLHKDSEVEDTYPIAHHEVEKYNFVVGVRQKVKHLEDFEIENYNDKDYKKNILLLYPDKKEILKISNRDLHYCHWQYILSIKDNVGPQINKIQEVLNNNFDHIHRFCTSMQRICNNLSGDIKIDNESLKINRSRDWRKNLSCFHESLQEDINILLSSEVIIFTT